MDRYYEEKKAAGLFTGKDEDYTILSEHDTETGSWTAGRNKNGRRLAVVRFDPGMFDTIIQAADSFEQRHSGPALTGPPAETGSPSPRSRRITSRGSTYQPLWNNEEHLEDLGPVTAEEIAVAIEGLSRKQQEAVVLVYGEGLTLRGAARQLGISPSSLHERLSTAKAVLASKLHDTASVTAA